MGADGRLCAFLRKGRFVEGGERCPSGQVPRFFDKFCAARRNQYVLLQNNVKCVTINPR